MKRFIIASALCCAAPAFADSFQVIDQSAGHKRIRIDNAARATMFNRQLKQAPSSKSLAPMATSGSGEVIAIYSLRGLRDAGLPAWVEQEVLEENGYGSWRDVPASKLDQTIDTQTFDLDAVSQVGASQAAGVAQSYYSLPEFEGGKVTPMGLCSKKWDSKSKTISRTFNNFQSTNKTVGGGGASMSLTADDVGAQASLKSDIRYSLKERCGIPYKARFDYANIDLDGVVSGSIDVSGSASYELEQDYQLASFELFSYKADWWVYIFEFELELGGNVDIGAKLNAEASATFDSAYTANGTVGLTWRCDSHGCDKRRDEVDLSFLPDSDNGFAAQVEVELMPYADFNFDAEFDMYWGGIEIADATLGVVAGLPVNYFGYYGNLCSDADGDGTRETVDASLVDVQAMLFAYLDVELFSKRKTYPISLGLSSWTKGTEQDPRVGGEENLTTFRKKLYFDDLLNGSTVIQPTFLSSAAMASDTKLKLGKRSCYPYGESVTYEINWGDGSPNTVTSATEIAHQWRSFGRKTVRAKIVTDAVGRRFETGWVTKVVTVSDSDQPAGTAGITITTGGNTNSQGLFQAVCLASGASCSVRGNRDNHSGDRSCTLYCPTGATVELTCENRNPDQPLDDVTVPSGATLVDFTHGVNGVPGHSRKIYRWNAAGTATARCSYTD